MVAAAALLLALAIDRWFGEPPARMHPVVWMGRCLGWIGRCIAPPAGAPAARWGPFVAGGAGWVAGAVLVVAVAFAIQLLAVRLPAAAAALLLALALKPLLAWRMLRDEVLAVDAALGVSLDAGRARLRHLVSRDVDGLSATEVRESAIESLAENLNDSVIAPLCWFLVLGLPGAALYRFANTTDAMWGYRGERGGRCWTWAGKWAARADDVLSWLPARLTACLLVVSGARRRGDEAEREEEEGTGAGLLRREARRTLSPNGGWPMAAMALRLGVRLSKPGVYVLNAGGRVPTGADVRRAVGLAGRSVVLMALLASAIALALGTWGRA